jgi:hypothetical protein
MEAVAKAKLLLILVGPPPYDVEGKTFRQAM